MEQIQYYLVVESFDRYEGDIDIVEIRAVAAKEAVTSYLSKEYFCEDEFTADGENGRYASESYTIGIGITKEKAALQYINSRMENQDEE